MTSPPSDEHLMRRWQDGDVQAFEGLVRRHRVPLFNFALRFVGQRPWAEDVVQETLLRLARHRSRYDGRVPVRTWLFTIARNQAVDLLRRETRRRVASLDHPASTAEGAAPLGDLVQGGGPAPDRGADAGRLRPHLEAALRALPDEQREVFVLREYSGVPFQEIARITGIGENTVKSRMRYALQGLRRSLQAQGVSPEDLWDPHPVGGRLGA